MSSPALTVVIPFRSRGPESLRDLELVVRSLAGQSSSRDTFEIVVVETDIEPRVDRERLGLDQVVFARYAARNFRRSWALNIGARHTTSAALLFHEADLLAPPDLVSAVLGRLRHADLVRPSPMVRDLTRAASRHVRREGLDAIASLKPSDYAQRPGIGGSVAIRRDPFERARGFNESFEAWGGDDEEFLLRARHTCGSEAMLDLRMLHLWHEQVRPPAEHYANLYLLDRARRHEAMGMDAYIASLPESYGDIDAFESS
ncbi:MAG TPA: galactosyltransferase-related protein [Sandaracinaceae bacterium LLY-WYZ-13_1]|nr:galactosyltransferase-related protein [Sandaracinaceae bacterium LLY-WYZ-13_1]